MDSHVKLALAAAFDFSEELRALEYRTALFDKLHTAIMIKE